MYKIQTLNKISSIGTDIFDKSKYSIADDCANPDAIMVRSAKMHDMQFGGVSATQNRASVRECPHLTVARPA